MLIEISYIGFKTQQIKVGSKINFDVILEEDIEALDEVVVTGYGSQKKMSVIVPLIRIPFACSDILVLPDIEECSGKAELALVP